MRDLPWEAQASLSDPLYLTQLPFTNKGFTGHESIQEVGLIHMNGRVYDPVLARFMSADVFIQRPWLSQSFNRYSYVMNNPMKYTDPTGYNWFTDKISSFSGGSKNKSRESKSKAKVYKVNHRPPKFEKDDKTGTYRNVRSNNGSNRRDKPVEVSNKVNIIYAKIKEASVNTANKRNIGGNGAQILSNAVNGSGLFSSAALLKFISGNGQQWKGKNGQWYSILWGGNQWAGGRSEILRRAKRIRAAGQGFFVLGTGLSLYEGANAFSNGDNFGILKSASDIGWGTAATFGGTVGLAGGVSYFGTSLILNIPAVKAVTVTPMSNGLCWATSNC
ncbi:MAG: hypothetical protein OFPII_15000 [Osedax symbiont Rs1]|nr:MAG: hypothetical protein OFPII_15000 [Osedax symbiont Rs1]